jgi:quercetin dioxygenase-like cupin family protein
MLVNKVANVEAQDLDDGKDIKNVKMRVLISEKDGAPNFRLRHFTIEPGGHTPLHRHDWEHENYFIKGKGILVSEKGETEVEAGMFGFVAPGELHQFKNPYDVPLEMLCLIPIPEKE